jgi:quercetin dioxygenase-like cupin family protein
MMDNIVYNKICQRVARFKELKSTPLPFVDSQIQGALRDIYLVIGKGVVEHSNSKIAISESESFNVTLVKAPPNNGASLHAHATSEVFVPLTGKWAFFWTNSKGQEEITLDPYDVFSCPLGVMRGFRNVADEDAWLLAVTGGDDSGRVFWHPDVIDKAAAHGWYLDDDGDVKKGVPGEVVTNPGSVLAQNALLKASEWGLSDMLGSQVAKFNKLIPSNLPFIDSILPGHERQNFNVLGAGVTEDASLEVSIKDDVDFNITYMKSSPGKGPALHDHKTVEVFMSLSGKWEILLGDDGENSIILEEFDIISIPPGVMRGLRNIGSEEQWLLTILGSSNPGRVSWHPAVLLEASKRGLTLDSLGNINTVIQ